MIDPEAIPQYTGNLERLEAAYGDLKADASGIRDTGREVHARFQGLSAYYSAPEAEQLFATTKPVAERSDAFAAGLETVSGALSGYAAEIRPLVERLKQLKAEARDFVDSVKDDDGWQYDGDKVAHHNRIRDEVTQTVAAFWAAERTCHNKITALWHGTRMVAGDGSDKKNQYGFDAAGMKNAKLPWGDPVEEKHHWWELGHWVKSFVWDGIIVDSLWGTVKGLGTLVGVNGWAAMGQAWKGLAQLTTGLVISSLPGAQALFWGLPEDKLPSWLRDSRRAMKETGKALVAWDEWGRNPARAAGAVTFNVLTTVFTGGEGAAAAGAGKAGAVARAVSVAGKVGRVIDPMTYVAKGAGAGLSKIGDITKALKGAGRIEIPELPKNALMLPEGTVMLPDGTVRLPQGAVIPPGAVRLPDGDVRLPHHEGPVLPEGTLKLPSAEGAPARYFDPQGNLLDEHGNVLQKGEHAEKEPGGGELDPQAGSDVPHTPTPVREPALVGAGAPTAEQAGEHIRVGDSVGHGDIGRATDNAAVHAGSEGVPTVHAGGDGLPGAGRADDHVPGGQAGDHLPGGSAHEHGAGPSGSNQLPPGHTDDKAHPASGHGHGQHEGHGDAVNATGEQHGHEAVHDGVAGGSGPGDPGTPAAHYSYGHPQGSPLDPQPDWHGQSADKMRHYRRPALDVSHLTPEDQLAVLKRESAALANDARDASSGVAAPGANHLDSGCAGSLLHDNVITVHSSTTKMHGQKLPRTHKVLEGILDQVKRNAEAAGQKTGFGHGKCAEVSLISDRLHQLDPTGKTVQTVADAKKLLEGSVMHTRQIGDLIDRRTGELVRSHGDFLPPCDTCKHVLPQLGIRVAR